MQTVEISKNGRPGVIRFSAKVSYESNAASSRPSSTGVEKRNTNSPFRVVPATLEFIVGAIILFGGAALVVLAGNLVDTTLGAVHMVLGLLAFPVGYGLLTGKSWSWAFALTLNTVSILFSAASEIVVVTSVSTTQVIVGSVGGTIVAILISLAIIYYLRKPQVKAFFHK